VEEWVDSSEERVVVHAKRRVWSYVAVTEKV
jgi:hypothetical protein